MTAENKPIENLMTELQERAKELNCLYTIEDTLNRSEISLRQAFHTVIDAIPSAFLYSNYCKARIIYGDIVYQTEEFTESKWKISEDIKVQDKVVGRIEVYYIEGVPAKDGSPFLKEEIRLIRTIADRLGHFILHNKLKNVINELQTVRQSVGKTARGEWKVVLDMIRKTDPNLFMSLMRKLLHLLCWKGVEEAELLMKHTSIARKIKIGLNDDVEKEDENKPTKVERIVNYDEYVDTIQRLADENLPDEVILSKIQKWIQEDKSSALIKVVDNQDTSLTEIAEALRKYYHLAPEKFELPPQTIKGLRVSLLRRFFTDQLSFISIAKEYVKLTDFYKLIDKMIFPPQSHGKLGGKSAGLFVASHILRKEASNNELLKNIKVPNTWYITSDGILNFMQHNNLEEVLEQKYKEIEEVRIEYPHIVQLFKNSEFPPDIVKGLSVALDDFGDVPLVVRSSSLLEDQMDASFSGKYKSLFLANRGSKAARLAALMDAIAEVYASTFSPDPIEYRAERGLLDFHEEMGIMIQEVIGKRVGDYFIPAYAGVAFSVNEFRWSPRIKREDGLLRIVPGLGTRAVDRLSDDYPILISPGQPSIRVNVTPEEVIRYSTKKVDVINLKTNEFETIDLEKLIKEIKKDYPAFEQVFSVLDGGMIRLPSIMDNDNCDYVVTFEGLFTKTDFLRKMDSILKTLQTRMKTPVDIEFVSDGNDLYLLQCRPQSRSRETAGDPIPKDIPQEKILFNAKKFVSNGKVPEITHVVYVDPQKYSELSDRNKLLKVGRVIGKLNKILPKRKFILLGPGRWGSRGDIKLGVSVTYSDINNTAMLIEIARKKGNYIPDVSFGTHFFQDLVEANIKYLPLYPDDPGIIFNEKFFNESKNILSEILPEYFYLEDTVKVIDVPASKEGMILRVLMNADLEEAVAIFTDPTNEVVSETELNTTVENYSPSDHWRWRLKMAENLAKELDAEKMGIKGIYLFGSVKNAISGPGSDIDLIIHIDENKCPRKELEAWLEGWSLCLSQINYMRTGIKTEGLLDIHFITDEDIKNKTSYAVKINALTDAAKPLKVIEKSN
ncbi:PEP/pyruvate-binding domain-containing protein [Melioribacter sp. Ez-97]|uniref:PEP/pyruvate-binding domain-containing protein n=1 Tax=Melioribacter sp. Ez-97 TaxID=3423434 RepID=UPI003EDB55A5